MTAVNSDFCVCIGLFGDNALEGNLSIDHLAKVEIDENIGLAVVLQDD